ncbi:MAG TPA: ABC transporter permease [Methanomassiliicoccales archaeon]|nr:ABC transporter permease [Methanomassiliicoccales archaeon]
MSRFLADLKAYVKIYTRSRAGMFFTFMLPVLLMVLFGAMFSNTSSSVALPVQNLDNGPASVAFLDALNQSGVVNVQMVPAGEDLNAYIQQHSLSMALSIPAGFSASVQQRMSDPSASIAQVTLYGDPTKSTFQMAQGATNGVIEAMNFQLAKAEPVLGVQAQTLPNVKSYTYMDFFLPGVIGMTVMSVSLYGMTEICSTYRNKGYFKLLATTKIRKVEWLTTKFVVFGMMLVGSLIVTYAVGVFGFGMTAPLTPLTFAFIFAGCFLFVSLGMLLGTVIKDAETGMAISNAIGFPMMFLAGSFFPIESYPSFLQGVANVLPLTYLNNGLRETMVYGNTGSALIDLAIVLVLGVCFALLSSRLMSWKES